VRRDALLIGLYVAAAIVFAIVVNADPDDSTPVFFVVLAAAIVAGWGFGKAGLRRLHVCVWLPWVVVLIGLPFGEAAFPADSSDTYPVAFYGVFAALPSMIAMLLTAGARALYEWRRHRAPPTAA
jgi:peptidoglycan/LPS O-acetylase OafA/YrhL